MKILITTATFGKYDPAPLNMLREKGYEIKLNPYKRKLTKEETIAFYQDNVYAAIAGLETIDEEVINKAAKLKVISRCGTGLDNIDLEAAGRRRIKVYSTPDAPSQAVAELAVCLMLAVLRRVPLADREIRQGIWDKRMGFLLKGRQVGIIGMGRIGRKVAEILRAFGALVFYADPRVTTGEYKKVELDELLKEADILSLHAASSEENIGLIGGKEIMKMKKGSFLINCSRGKIVDEAALYSALKDGALAGAGVDVYEEEPYQGPLRELDNVVLTPHIGSYAKETRIDMEMRSVENLLRGINA